MAVKDGFVDALSNGLRLGAVVILGAAVRRLALPAGAGRRPAGRRRRGRRARPTRPRRRRPRRGRLMPWPQRRPRRRRRRRRASAAGRGGPTPTRRSSTAAARAARRGRRGRALDGRRGPAGRCRQGDDLPALGVQGGAGARRPAHRRHADPAPDKGTVRADLLAYTDDLVERFARDPVIRRAPPPHPGQLPRRAAAPRPRRVPARTVRRRCARSCSAASTSRRPLPRRRRSATPSCSRRPRAAAASAWPAATGPAT